MLRMLRFVWDMFVSHKVRFLLTISGIVVGVASLVAMASLLYVGESVLRASSMQASGEDIVNVRNDWRSRDKYPNEKRLDAEDKAALDESLLLDSTSFTAVFGGRTVLLSVGKAEVHAEAVGVEDPVFQIHSLEMARGRPFGPADYQSSERVVILGSKMSEKLGDPALGTIIRVGDVLAPVIGVLEKKPSMGPGEWGWNNRVVMPARIYNLEFNPDREPDTIVGRVAAPMAYGGLLKDFVTDVRGLVRVVLMQSRTYENFDLGDSKGGGGPGTEEMILLTIKVLLFLTTIFSMVVGGINIMNIMLVTVTERTREIGIRRALGATRRDILRQFLFETLGVTLTGAFIGVGLGAGALAIAAPILSSRLYPWPFYVAPWSLGLGLGFSVVIGLIFGISPAMRAADLDPVEALRYE